MKLFKEILAKVLEKEDFNIIFPNLKINATEVIETKCYEALQKIKAVIENDSLSDFDCIEEIVCVFEIMGSKCRNRHDFG